jgi:3-dehydroquinate synthase
MADEQAQRVIDVLRRLGFELGHPALEQADELMVGLEEFREHLGGPLTITLPRGLGQAIDVHEIDRERMKAAIAAAMRDPASR